MDNQDLITVVVPVYNVERYLEDCVASVVNQTCRNLEILLVDDGSRDASGKMCDRWAERDPRIRVIHKENGGLSDARNRGLQEAKGTYIAFVDSDDWVSPAFLECLYKGITEHHAQVSCCAMAMFEDGQAYPAVPGGAFPEETLSGRDMILALYGGRFQAVGVVACDKLYDKALFLKTGIHYPKGKLYEDTFTTYRLLYNAEKIAVCQRPLYGYRQRFGSITNSQVSKRRCRDGIEADYSNVAFFKERQEPVLTERAINAFFESTVRTYKRIAGGERTEETEECMQMLVKAFRRVWREDRSRFRFGFVKTAAYGLFFRMPALAARLIP